MVNLFLRLKVNYSRLVTVFHCFLVWLGCTDPGHLNRFALLIFLTTIVFCPSHIPSFKTPQLKLLLHLCPYYWPRSKTTPSQCSKTETFPPLWTGEMSRRPHCPMRCAPLRSSRKRSHKKEEGAISKSEPLERQIHSQGQIAGCFKSHQTNIFCQHCK